MTHQLYEIKRKDLFPENAVLGLKASAPTNLNPHTIYPKQFLKDNKIEQFSEKHMKRKFKGQLGQLQFRLYLLNWLLPQNPLPLI